MEKAERDIDSKDESKGDAKVGRRPRRERNVEESNPLPPASSKNPTVAAPVNESIPEIKGRGKRENAGEIDEMANRKANADGWMMFAPADAKKTVVKDENEDVANNANKDKHFQETGGDDIMLIPDLDDDGDSDQRVAHAPRNVARKIPTLSELESDVKSSIPKAEGGLDLSYLLAALVPQSQLTEPDTCWTFDELLRDVTDELTGMQKIVIATVTKELGNSKVNPAPAPIQVTKEKVKIDKRKN